MSDNNICVYAGSFDPPTMGHMFMIEKGADLFQDLIVAIGSNPGKQYSFSLDDRLAMLQECTGDYDNVQIDHFQNQFLVDYADSVNSSCILRGIRSQQDYEFERAMRNVNEDLNAKITTVFLMPPREICEISSSLIKGLVGPEGWEDTVRPYVPDPVYKKLLDTPIKSSQQSAGHETASEASGV